MVKYFMIFCVLLGVIMMPQMSSAEDREAGPALNRKIFHGVPQAKQDWGKILKLDDEQKKLFDKIQAESKPKISAIMQQIMDLHRQMADIRAEDEQKLQKILNEQQLAKFNKIKARGQKQNRQKQPREERRRRFKMGEN